MPVFITRPLSLLILLFHPAVHATGGNPGAPGVPTSSFIQATLALAFIVGLLFLFAFLTRKLLGGKGFGQGGLRLLGGIALGPKERIVLVEAGEEWLVIGIVPGQIRTLHTLPKGSLPEDKLSPSTPPPFAQWLQQVMNRRKHESPSSQSHEA